MKDIFDSISNWPVLKWVILVLVAGFIGQFGKMLAEAIIERVRRRRAANQASKAEETPQSLPSSPAGPALSDQPAIPANTVGIPDKKQLKALAKARKKEAKLK